MRCISLILLFFIAGCCSVGGTGGVDCSYIISPASPRQTASLFKCALLYDSNGAEVAYNCFSKNTKDKIPFWKFKYGFNLVEYDKNKEIKLWEILTALQVEAEENTDESHTILICVVSDRFAKEHKKSYSEFVYMVKEGEEWKLDLVKTLMERGPLEDLDKMEKENLEGRQENSTGGGGCLLCRDEVSNAHGLGQFLPLLFLLTLLYFRSFLKYR